MPTGKNSKGQSVTISQAEADRFNKDNPGDQGRMWDAFSNTPGSSSSAPKPTSAPSAPSGPSAPAAPPSLDGLNKVVTPPPAQAAPALDPLMGAGGAGGGVSTGVQMLGNGSGALRQLGRRMPAQLPSLAGIQRRVY